MFRILSKFESFKHVINISVDVGHGEYISSGSKIQDRTNIKKKFRYTESELDAYDDFITNMVNVLVTYNFDIIGEYRSNIGYNYYVEFYPTDHFNNRLDKFLLVIRIGDHKMKSSRDSETIKSNNKVIKSFWIGSEQYPSTYKIRESLIKICEELQNENYDILDEY